MSIQAADKNLKYTQDSETKIWITILPHPQNAGPSGFSGGPFAPNPLQMMMNPQQMMAMAAASGGNSGANMLGGLPMEVLMNPELFAAQVRLII